MLIMKRIQKGGMILTGIYAKEERSPIWGTLATEPDILIYAEYPSWGWSKIYKPKDFVIVNEEGTKSIENEEDMEGFLAFHYDEIANDFSQYTKECVEEFV